MRGWVGWGGGGWVRWVGGLGVYEICMHAAKAERERERGRHYALRIVK